MDAIGRISRRRRDAQWAGDGVLRQDGHLAGPVPGPRPALLVGAAELHGVRGDTLAGWVGPALRVRIGPQHDVLHARLHLLSEIKP